MKARHPVLEGGTARGLALLLPFVLALLPHGWGVAQSKGPSSEWPDNIVSIEKLIGENKISDEGRAEKSDAARAYVCALLGKKNTGIGSKEFDESGVILKETKFLSGQQRMVITEKVYLVSNEESRCDLRLASGITYDYASPGVRWTAIKSPKGIVLHEKNAGQGNAVVEQTQEMQFQNRLRKFSGKWRKAKYDDIEVHFGQRCGYPPDPANLAKPKGMGEFGSLYEKALAVAQQFHQDGTRLCSLIDSPEHVGTGEKLVLHVKEPKRNYDENTGCYDFERTGDLLKRKCEPIVVSFQVGAAMPPGVFEKPDWARGAVSKPFDKNASERIDKAGGVK